MESDEIEDVELDHDHQSVRNAMSKVIDGNINGINNSNTHKPLEGDLQDNLLGADDSWESNGDDNNGAANEDDEYIDDLYDL